MSWGGPAATYLNLMRHNMESLINAFNSGTGA